MRYVKLFDSFDSDIIIYHGSPVKFSKFDVSKLSRKMSQDTYGWGIYLTDSVSLAKVYATMNDNKRGYVYEVSISSGDFLIFENKPTSEQLSKIQKGLDDMDMDIDISGELYDRHGDVFIIDNSWSLYKYIYEMFYETYPIKKQINYGINSAKRDASMFLADCGIIGLTYPLESSSKIAIEYGHSGKGYVVYDSNSLTIKKVSRVNSNF